MKEWKFGIFFMDTKIKAWAISRSGYQLSNKWYRIHSRWTYFRNHSKESEHLIKTIILTFSDILDLQILLEQAENRGQRALPGLPSTVLRESGRLQAPHIWRNCQNKGRQTAQRPGQEAEDLREPQAPGQRESGAEKSCVRCWLVSASRGPGRSKEARLLWQVWKNSQSCH